MPQQRGGFTARSADQRVQQPLQQPRHRHLLFGAVTCSQPSSKCVQVRPRAASRQIYQIWEGTAEIQRLVIARDLTGRAL